MEEIAQSVGNEEMPGEFDWDATTDVDLNTNDSGPLGSNPALGHEEALSLLFQKIVQLPLGRKKVLAMLYHEHIPLSEIAARMGVAESPIGQIDAQTIALLRNYLWGVSEPVNASFSQESNPVFLHPPTDTSAKK
jgi:DNA-directed RNA polymerase specialized sigma subunit